VGEEGEFSYEDSCSFTCNTGYELTGSDTRTCQSDGSWSGVETMCSRGIFVMHVCQLLLFKLCKALSRLMVVSCYAKKHKLHALNNKKATTTLCHLHNGAVKNLYT